MISSTGNTRVRAVCALNKKAKERRQQGLFVVEGPKMFAELPAGHLREAYVSESFLRQYGERAERLLAGCRYETVSDEVMRYMSDTQTPQGILAVAEQFSYDLEDVLGGYAGGKADDQCGGLSRCGKTSGSGESGYPVCPPHLMILETIQDPGNLGTILRAGEGAGISGVIMDAGTADLYNPKVIRSTMGSIYRVPFFYTEDLHGVLKQVKKRGIRLFAAHLKGERNYEEEDYRAACGFLIGNEARGLKEDTAAMADCYVRIPMAGKVESLNAAVAASILMFETARQRRSRSGE